MYSPYKAIWKISFGGYGPISKELTYPSLLEILPKYKSTKSPFRIKWCIKKKKKKHTTKEQQIPKSCYNHWCLRTPGARTRNVTAISHSSPEKAKPRTLSADTDGCLPLHLFSCPKAGLYIPAPVGTTGGPVPEL